MKEKRGAELLAQARKAKQKQQKQKDFTKIVGKKKNKDRFGKVNFNG